MASSANLAWYDPKASTAAAGYTPAGAGCSAETSAKRPQPPSKGEPARVASTPPGIAPELDPEMAAASPEAPITDVPGLYRLIRRAIIKEGVAWDSKPVKELEEGTVVDVVEVAAALVDRRVRARIADPAGWISLVSVANGVRFADRVSQVASAAAPSPEEVPERREQSPQPPRPPHPPKEPSAAQAPRNLDVNEVARTVDAAVRAKEELAKHSLSKARSEMLARKADMEARHAEEERRIKEAEAQLAELETELHTGVTRDGRARVEELRRCIEGVGKEVAVLEREVASRKEAMRRATEAYVDMEERLAEKREARERYEKEMLDLILTTGKAKDERMNSLLSKVPAT